MTDPGRIPAAGVFHLGFAHRQCIDRARQRLMAGEVDLPSDIRELRIEPADDPPENLDAPPRPDQCPFCVRTTPMTDEHVLPAWMIREFRSLADGSLTFGRHGEAPVPTRSPDVTVLVCEECNHRWLSVLENDITPLLRPMIRGRDCDLSPKDQALLATWAVKTALLMNLLDPDTAFIPLGHYRELRQLRQAPKATMVWIGGYCGNTWASWGCEKPLPSGVLGTERPDAFLTTFTAFRVVFQVFGHLTRGKATIDDNRVASLALHRISPSRNEVLRWPRDGLAFGDASLQELADSFEEAPGPG